MLRLHGFTDWEAGVTGDPIDPETLDTWTTNLDHKLTDFVDILRNCEKLEVSSLKLYTNIVLTFRTTPDGITWRPYRFS
jgi:hypothetical protein